MSRARPLAVMREIVTTVRALLANETVTFHGEYVHLEGVELDYVHQERRPKDVPIYIGATGDKMMELTGEIADGVVLNYLVSPSYNRKAMELLAAGAAQRRTDRRRDRPSSARGVLDGHRRLRGRTTVALNGARLLVPSTWASSRTS